MIPDDAGTRVFATFLAVGLVLGIVLGSYLL